MGDPVDFGPPVAFPCSERTNCSNAISHGSMEERPTAWSETGELGRSMAHVCPGWGSNPHAP